MRLPPFLDDVMDQVETLARAICAADDRGPDARVPKPTDRPAGDPAGEVPQWRLYEPQARRMIATQGALLDRGETQRL